MKSLNNILILYSLIFLIHPACSVSKITVKNNFSKENRTSVIIYCRGNTAVSSHIKKLSYDILKENLVNAGIFIKNGFIEIEAAAPDAIKSDRLSLYSEKGDMIIIYSMPLYKESYSYGFIKRKKLPFMIGEDDFEVNDIIKYQFKIRIIIKQADTNQVLLEAENIHSETTNKDPLYNSLDEFAAYILRQTGKELRNSILEAE
ncbi:MAG TPA: hypothetical protein PLT13_12215 [Spirochaetota bacterium]|nr:hypothetical protein [Spirochaetota bacterium]HPR38351.1 hypothetical protein [Spirochaetota bacterium]